MFVETEEDREGEADLWRREEVQEKSLGKSMVPKRDISPAVTSDDCGLVGVRG